MIEVTCYNAVQAHNALNSVIWPMVKAKTTAGQRMVLTLKKETRSIRQNSRLWAMLTDVSQQVDWYGRKLKPEEWKHVFSAALQKQDVVPNIDGTGFVALGISTSKMTKSEMCDMQTLIEAFGAEKGIRFSKNIDYETGEIN